jgi:hypothetical protein
MSFHWSPPRPIRLRAAPLRVATQALACLALGAAALSGSAHAQGTPAAPKATSSAATARAASAVAVEISAAVKGQIISCPAALKLSPSAVCLYVGSGATTLRPVISGRLSGRTVGSWKTAAKSSTLLVTETPGGPVGAFVLLSALNDKESLIVVDAAQGKAAAAGKPAAPAGVVKGQPYVLGRDLAGVVNVTSLGAGKFRLTTEDGPALTVTVGQKNAGTVGGTVELPLAPATDGQNLIFPLAGLRSLGCTVTPAGSNLTVACGADSIGLKPIVF